MDNYNKESKTLPEKTPDVIYKKLATDTKYDGVKLNQNKFQKDNSEQSDKNQQSKSVSSDGKKYKAKKSKIKWKSLELDFQNDPWTRTHECSKHRICCLNLKLFQDLIEKDANSICLKLGSCEECFKYFLNKPIDLHTTTLFLKVLRQSLKSFILKEMNNKHLSLMMYSTFFDHINDVIIAIRDINDKEKDFLTEILNIFKFICYCD
eukprot:XP_014781925.1 PREDICTED: uncharacterized protein LOC106877513 [Octopus bimaculoides]